MELCEGGDLATVLRSRRRRRQPMSEAELWRLAGEAAYALRDCHRGAFGAKKGGVILHRDLKPANILFDADGSIKLGDFGLAKELAPQGLTRTNLGTPLYMAPEIVERKPYGAAADMWSLGCILHEAATFEPPFDAKHRDDLHANILTGRRKAISASYSSSFRELVASLLRVDPRDRSSAADILGRCSRFRKIDRGPDEPAPPAPPAKEDRQKALEDRERALDVRQRAVKIAEDDLRKREAAFCKRVGDFETRQSDFEARQSDFEARQRDFEDRCAAFLRYKRPSLDALKDHNVADAKRQRRDGPFV